VRHFFTVPIGAPDATAVARLQAACAYIGNSLGCEAHGAHLPRSIADFRSGLGGQLIPPEYDDPSGNGGGSGGGGGGGPVKPRKGYDSVGLVVYVDACVGLPPPPGREGPDGASDAGAGAGGGGFGGGGDRSVRCFSEASWLSLEEGPAEDAGDAQAAEAASAAAEARGHTEPRGRRPLEVHVERCSVTDGPGPGEAARDTAALLHLAAAASLALFE